MCTIFSVIFLYLFRSIDWNVRLAGIGREQLSFDRSVVVG